MEKPILFSAPMVNAILDGRKTMTRRVADGALWKAPDGNMKFIDKRGIRSVLDACPYGKAGDLLWVREAWRVGAWSEDGICVDYRADNHCRKEWLSVPDEEMFERLWTDSTDDAIKAGMEPDESGMYWWQPGEAPTRWRPSIFMPRWARRIALRITDVRIERLQDITDGDAVKEGIRATGSVDATGITTGQPVQDFARLWDGINEKRGYGWDANPYVWVISFERAEVPA